MKFERGGPPELTPWNDKVGQKINRVIQHRTPTENHNNAVKSHIKRKVHAPSREARLALKSFKGEPE